MSKRKPKLIDVVRIGGPGLTDEERTQLEEERNATSAKNLQMIQGLNTYGVQVDAGLEAITQFRRFLQELGILTPDQRLASEVLWEDAFNNQLKASISQVRQMQAQAQLARPASGLIIPGSGGN